MGDGVRLSERALAMPASPIRRLAPFAVAARKAGKHVHGLNIGQPDIPTPPEILDRLKRFDHVNVAYGPSEGLPEFVDAIRRYHEKIGLPVETRDIFATTGGSEALLFVMAAICDAGDEVIVFEPFYTNYSGFAGMIDVKTVPVTTRPDDGYHLPPAEVIERAVTPRTRAILLCSPNNPTGTVYSDDELERVGEICRRRGLFLVADEVYREFCYGGLKHRSALTLEGLEDQVILTDSLSKRVSLCGARVGWIISKNRKLMDCLLRFGQARLCPPTLGQYIAAGFADVSEQYMNEVIAEYEKRRDIVYDALSATPGVTVRKPEGAFYLCARLPVDDANTFAEYLLKDFAIDGETVMFAPADGFYATPGLGKDEARFAYVIGESPLNRAMTIVTEALKTYPGRTP